MMFYFYYFIVFSSSQLGEISPIVYETNSPFFKNGMHLLDPEIVCLSSALEYAMHLPRHIYDLYDLDENFLSASHDNPHFIIPVPENVLLSRFLIKDRPTLFILGDDCDVATKQHCQKMNPFLNTVYIKELNQQLLLKHWDTLSQQRFSMDFDVINDVKVQYLLKEKYLLALPELFVSRQWNDVENLLFTIYNSTNIENECIRFQQNYKIRLNTLLSIGKQGISANNISKDQFFEKYNEQIFIEAKKFDISVIVTFPGVSKKQIKYGLSSENLLKEEKRFIRILGVHRAIARGGVILELPCAKTDLFSKYAELEDRCINGTNNKYVWKALYDFGKLLGTYFNEEQINVLKSAKDITVFSDIPIGLAIFKDDEVPLQCYKKHII